MDVNPPRYFSGSLSNLGQVRGLDAPTFAQLCVYVRAHQTVLSLTRAALHALPEKEQQKAKRSDYMVPAIFASSPSPRKTEHAIKCNLLFLDVDDAPTAQRLLAENWEGIASYGHIVWHTARSTEAKPRLRVCVHAEGIPVNQYAAAVRTVAEALGIAAITHESLVPVQPMYLPVSYRGDGPEDSPIVTVNPEGDPFMLEDIGGATEEAPSVDPSVGDLDNLRPPMEGITMDDARSALAKLDPDCSMQDWIEVAAGLKHQFGEEGYALWDQWSARGKKYEDAEATAYRWGTLKANTPNRAPVTIRSLFKRATERGWSNKPLAERLFAETKAWLTSESRSSEELLDTGAKRIAQVSDLVGQMRQTALVNALQKSLGSRAIKLNLPDIRSDIRQAAQDAGKVAGLPAWANGVCFITALNKFYRHASDRRFAPEVLDLMYTAPDDMRPRDYLMKQVNIPQVENLRYDPAMGEKRFFKVDGVPYVNTYRASYPKAEPGKAEEAGAIVTEHLGNLVSEPEYQGVILDFISFLVQHPGRKIRWAILLQGAQGCGKTFLAVVASTILGRRNVKKISAGNVLEKTFNSWAYGSQLCVIEEVRIVGSSRYGVMDQLKPCISDDEVSIRELQEPVRTVPNITNYLMFTNHHDALAINDDDRRYFVLGSPIQRREQVPGSDYFDRIYGMIRDNPAGLRAWFEQRKISPDFRPDGRAPRTPYLSTLADNAASPLLHAVKEALAEADHALIRPDLISMTTLRALIEQEKLPYFSNQALSACLRDLGWEKRARVQLDGAKHLLWSMGVVMKPIQKFHERAEVL